ncbi:MAG: hypothetical protein QGI83_16990 [Candidatus Latescibacteria bacterium]|nr:hypothetical protein [Candidatus Latescibacterota bacterium]
MITTYGAALGLAFLICYLGQSISSGMKGKIAKQLQWGCWLLAAAAMVACYLLTDTHVG